MSDKLYQVGDFAKMTNCEVFPEYNDTVCKVVGGYKPTIVMNSDTFVEAEILAYTVRTNDGRTLAARKDQLKPRETPPMQFKKEQVEA